MPPVPGLCVYVCAAYVRARVECEALPYYSAVGVYLLNVLCVCFAEPSTFFFIFNWNQ